MKKIEAVEKKLRRAFEDALEAGYYPEDGTFADRHGGCCAMGVYGVISGFVENQQYSRPSYAVALGITTDEVTAIIIGFDGCKNDASPELKSWVELGERLREDYFLCDGERP